MEEPSKATANQFYELLFLVIIIKFYVHSLPKKKKKRKKIIKNAYVKENGQTILDKSMLPYRQTVIS